MPRRRAQLCAAALLLAAPLLAPAPPVAVALLAAAGATEAAAQAARSSGGYSRPSMPRARTPSVGGGGRGGWGAAAPRTPSFGGGGGYSRPGGSIGGRGPSSYGSAGDRAYSRQGSASALERYRAQADAARRQREAAPPPIPPPAAGTTGRERWGLPPARPRYDHRPDYGRGYGTDWYRDRGWSGPGARGLGGGVLGGGRSFGIWDGLFLGFLLNNLTRAGSVDFFRNHQDDPGLREWRQEAERQARDNAELREKLDRLDRELARRSGEGQPAAPPRDPNYLPPDVPPEVALAPAPGNDVRTPTAARRDGDAGFGLWLPVLLVGGAGLAFLSWRRGRGRGSSGPASAGGGGGVKGPLGSAGAMLRHKLGGERYAPSLFRVGMTVTVDPTPFILAGGAIKVPAPVSAGAGGGERVSVAEVGRVEGGAVDYVRLYLPERRGFFQVHTGEDGQPDECRFFAPIDEVSPASEAEWGAWLDPAEGMIGWPEFQTKDGKLYGRVWSPEGEGRVRPRTLVETIEGVGGSRAVRSQAMLYAAPTGAADPAPPVEYILVAAVEAEGQAWVEINAGIDVNPATLSLA
jgi:hypothetical protein